ncbi:unnamed protein product [Microthlaspi erraticum]|uniref:Uncharacterized protein n=1 Tax=Microthlaspi erraticum TaxID=1685480 RepID=A0A6D2IJB5_9BRAS|nr:unnamed protein product [Microthlaspi erraticum]
MRILPKSRFVPSPFPRAWTSTGSEIGGAQGSRLRSSSALLNLQDRGIALRRGRVSLRWMSVSSSILARFFVRRGLRLEASGISRTGGKSRRRLHFVEPGGAEYCVIDGRFVHDNELQELRNSADINGEPNCPQLYVLGGEAGEGTGCGFDGSCSTPMRSSVSRKMRFTVLPVSIRTFATSQS